MRGLHFIVWVSAVAGLSAGGACRNQTLRVDAAVDRPVDQAVDRPADRAEDQASDHVTGAGGDRGDGSLVSDGATPPPGLSFPDPPVVSCAGDAGGAQACDSPVPGCSLDAVCEDGGGCSQRASWMVYYDNPRCQQGRCVWDQRFYQCAPGGFCITGGCIDNGTLIP